MTKRVVVDPVTRIEGHLRDEAMLDDSKHIQDAMCRAPCGAASK